MKTQHIALLLALTFTSLPALAGDADPLFINLTTADPHRARMAVVFGEKQFERGHALTLFLNDRGVLLASRKHAARYPQQQALLRKLLDQGATVLICPMCMAHYQVAEANLLPGVQIGNPELTGNALFKDHTRTLTW